MSIWFGAALSWVRDIKKSLELGEPHLKPMVSRINSMSILSTISGTITIVTGVVFIFLKGGFGVVPIRIHIGFTFALAMFVIGVFVIRPTWAKIEGTIASNGDINNAKLNSKKIAMLTSIFHLLWLLTLVTMVVPFEAL
jgi:hypothetical protein